MSGEGAPLRFEDGEALSDGPTRTVRALFEHPLLDVTWSRYDAGERGPGPHVHHTHVDAFFILDGALTFVVGPDVEPVTAPAGTFVLVPPNVVHGFDNESAATTRWLNFHAPSTGFIATLRGDRPSFDSRDAPSDGGRPASEATVLVEARPGLLADDPRFIAELVECSAGALDDASGPAVGISFTAPVEPARYLRVRAPGTRRAD